MEASTLRPAATLPKPRLAVGAPLLRLRSDEQLVALFRAGHDEAFRAIHDRYHRRLFAYARQMLPARQDAEDVLQDVFVRAYDGLRASDRDLALRAWLFRVAHNRCVDQLRSRPSALPHEFFQLLHPQAQDPIAEVDLRESLRRLVSDIRRLPDQQRSALLMRELGGMTYVDIASSLGVSVGAVKSLLVRARLALAQASEARDTSCAVIRAQLVEAHDRGIRPNANARKHLRDCTCCKSFRRELRGVSRQLAAVAPAAGPLGVFAKLLGFSGGGGAAGGAGGSVALLGGGTGASAGGLALGTTHVATLIVAAVATAGGAVELQRTLLPLAHHPAKAMSVSAKQTSRHVIAPLSSTAAAAPTVPGPVAPLVARDPSSAASDPPVLRRAPVKRTVRNASHALRASPVTVYGLPSTTSTATAGAETGGTCSTGAPGQATAGGAGSSTAASQSSPQSTSATTPAAATPSTGGSATTAPATGAACGSTTGSSAAGSSSAAAGTVSPTGTGTSTTATTTGAGSSTSGTTVSSTGTSSSASGSSSTSE